MGNRGIVQASKNKNLADIVYSSIKNSILQNELGAGDLLSENLIAKKFEMSRTPVREALKTLAQEGTIEILHGIGARVKDISLNDIIDIFEIRKALEVVAIKSAMSEFTEEEITNLENQFNSLKQKKDLGEEIKIEEFTCIDRQFHDLIIEKSKNKYVKDIMETINFNIQRYMKMSITALGNLEQSTNQHLELVKLIREKDLDTLISSLENHIDWSLEWIIKGRQKY